MATSMTLAQLQTAVLQRADMVNSQFIDQTIPGGELTSYINQSAFEYFDLLVSKYGNNYAVATPYVFTTDGVNDQYALPVDFYKLLGVDIAISPGNVQNGFATMKPFNMDERNKYPQIFAQGVYYGRKLRYKLFNNNMWIRPFPAANQIVQIYYVPKFTPLVAGTDVLEGYSGWTEYVIIDAAIKCLQKEESDVTVLGLQKAAMIARIEAMAENRDAGSPATVQDSQDLDDWDGSNDGNGYY